MTASVRLRFEEIRGGAACKGMDDAEPLYPLP